jgi:hypothetical protein
MGVNTSLPNSVTYVVSNFGGRNPRFPGGQSFLVILPRLPRPACVAIQRRTSQSAIYGASPFLSLSPVPNA